MGESVTGGLSFTAVGTGKAGERLKKGESQTILVTFGHNTNVAASDQCIKELMAAFKIAAEKCDMIVDEPVCGKVVIR